MAQYLASEEILLRIERAEELCERLKRAIGELVPQWSLAPGVQTLQAGVSLITAAVFVAEIGNFASSHTIEIKSRVLAAELRTSIPRTSL